MALLSCHMPKQLSAYLASTGADRSTACENVEQGLVQGIEAEERTLAYWMTIYQLQGLDPDEVLLKKDDIVQRQNSSEVGRAYTSSFMPSHTLASVSHEVKERYEYMVDKVRSSQLSPYPSADPKDNALPVSEALEILNGSLHNYMDGMREPSTLVTEDEQILYCAPVFFHLYTSANVNRDFERNHCGKINAGEAVVAFDAKGDFRLVRSRHSLGWIKADAVLKEAETQHGQTWGAFSRRNFLEQAFSKMGAPYVWANAEEDPEVVGLDCSGLTMDSMEPLGVELPRHSQSQVLAASFSVPLPAVRDATKAEDLEQKKAWIEMGHKQGLVLLGMPGHIMIYLGKNKEGEMRVLHAFYDFLEPCGADGAGGSARKERHVKIAKVEVTGLELGAGTSRTSLIERADRMAVFGTPKDNVFEDLLEWGPPSLGRLTEIPSPSECRTQENVQVFSSPEHPYEGEALRWTAISTSRDGKQGLHVFDPDGHEVEASLEQGASRPLYHLSKRHPVKAGRYVAVFTEGGTIRGCKDVVVSHSKRVSVRGVEREGQRWVWYPKRNWDPRSELLYAVFVQHLFHDRDKDRTFSGLNDLLRNPNKNILYHHLNQDEEEGMNLSPDCADLPYFLRAYVAWKLELPFGYRSCGRHGRIGCSEPLFSNLTAEEEAAFSREDVKAFERFLRRNVGFTVHSGTARTSAEQTMADLYPVDLSREALLPGTVFADPYGHVLLLTRFEPAHVDEHGVVHPGVLMGADAQPDATIGQRTFWEGTFLFYPDANKSAGFKTFVPYRIQKDAAATSLALEDASRLPRYSLRQYEGTKEQFYETVTGLIDPLPRSKREVLDAKINALYESAKRRVVSVRVSEEDMAQHPGRVVAMPEAHRIFQTQGAWEDFSTPSRDFRLLIAIDTVMQMDLSQDQGLGAYRESRLKSLGFEYMRSDGSPWKITLWDVVQRSERFLMGYNPNDCPEWRWGAPESSAEFATCRGRAPDVQQEKMRTVSPWFNERQRPVP